MSKNVLDKFLHSGGAHMMLHRAAHETVKYVQSSQFQNQMQQLGQAIIKAIR